MLHGGLTARQRSAVHARGLGLCVLRAVHLWPLSLRKACVADGSLPVCVVHRRVEGATLKECDSGVAILVTNLARQNKPAIAQLAEHLTVECCSNQMVPGSTLGGQILAAFASRAGGSHEIYDVCLYKALQRNASISLILLNTLTASIDRRPSLSLSLNLFALSFSLFVSLRN